MFYVNLTQNRRKVKVKGVYVDVVNIYGCDCVEFVVLTHTVPAAYPEQKCVRNVRAHREMVIHIERTGFVVLVRIVTNDSRSKISRFKRNMPAYESVLSGLTLYRSLGYITHPPIYTLLLELRLCRRST